MKSEEETRKNEPSPGKAGRGGKREGAGRKAKDTVRIEVRMAPAVAAAFRAKARNAKKSLGDMVAEWIQKDET